MIPTVITDEISQDLEHALDVMREYDIDAAELRGLWDTNIADLSSEQVEQAVRALKERDMRVAALSTPFFKCELGHGNSAVEKRQHLAKERGFSEQGVLLLRLCEIADAFDTRCLRVFSFWKRGELTPTVEARILEAFAGPIEVAKRNGITLLLENEGACYVGTGGESARLLSALNTPQVRACWDPGNAYIAGEDPLKGEQAVSGFIAHVHVKDVRTGPDGSRRCVVLGEGEMDYGRHFAALRSVNYAGCLSLETDVTPDGGTPEDASRSSLTALRCLLSV